ncbi:CoA transferase [Bradyrhizobium sp. STM 3561]|uniref:CoA transferase n=1 Tax=Bradyrhizobium sp. STM 3561 TaxID=578923 RepID=UPI00388E8C21
MEGNEAELPLSGVTVVSLEQAIAAPLASRHLADWGARVIKMRIPTKSPRRTDMKSPVDSETMSPTFPI